MKKSKIAIIIISVLLILSVGVNCFLLFADKQPLSWLQSKGFVQETTLGILANSKDFREGEDITIEYDFENEEYSTLLEKYDIEETAGTGSEFEKAKKLMHEYSHRIKHSSDVAVSAENMNAQYLLETYLDNKDQGTYCRAKAQILNEMCLALKIYSRKIWILPLSVYDNECHVVNEIWDSTLEKWVMLDITNDLYWVDENAAPLSMLEVRDKLINGEFCTPVSPDDDLDDLEQIRQNNDYNYTYYVKNLAALGYMDSYTVGETKGCYLLPVNYSFENEVSLISREAVERRPYN